MPPPPTPSKWYHNVWFVLGMLLFVLGPFGLPLVWNNPNFSRRAKVILTLVMVVFTLLLVDVTIRAVNAVVRNMQQLDALYR
jgi:hypothetical protein